MLRLVKNANADTIVNQVMKVRKVKILGPLEEARKHSKLSRKLSLRKQTRARAIALRNKKKKKNLLELAVTVAGLNNEARTHTKTIQTITTH